MGRRVWSPSPAQRHRFAGGLSPGRLGAGATTPGADSDYPPHHHPHSEGRARRRHSLRLAPACATIRAPCRRIQRAEQGTSLLRTWPSVAPGGTIRAGLPANRSPRPASSRHSQPGCRHRRAANGGEVGAEPVAGAHGRRNGGRGARLVRRWSRFVASWWLVLMLALAACSTGKGATPTPTSRRSAAPAARRPARTCHQRHQLRPRCRRPSRRRPH